MKKLDILSEVIDEPIKKWLMDTGKTLVLSASGEISERLMNACRGAFNWYQLLQIPVEICTNLFLQHVVGCDKIQAYGWSKLASFLTAAGIGALAGPFGALGAIGFWIASEIFAYFFRKFMEKFLETNLRDPLENHKLKDWLRGFVIGSKPKLRLGCFMVWLG